MQNRAHNVESHSIQDTALPLAPTIRQIDVLQVLRAVAVVLVVLCHSGQILGDMGLKSLPNLGVFGVDIFFVISGFILSLAVLKDLKPAGRRSSWNFLKRRFIRIYPIYWVIALLVLARLARAHQLLKHDYVPAFFLLPSIHYPVDPHIIAYSWTMMFEMFFYVLLGLILLRTMKWAVPVLIVLLLCSVLVGSIIGIHHPVWVVAGNPILLEFVFGAVVALLYKRFGRQRAVGIFAMIVGAAAAIFVETRNWPNVADGFQMIVVDHGAFARVATWGVCAALVVGGAVFWSPSMQSFFGRWGVLMGNASYSAYLVSALVLEFGTRLFRKVGTPTDAIWGRLLYQSCMVVAVMVTGFWCYVLIEKPMLKWLQDKLLKKKPAASRAPIAQPVISGASMPGVRRVEHSAAISVGDASAGATSTATKSTLTS